MKLDKNIYNNTLDFFKRRFIELFGLLLISLFFIFSYSLFSYSPENSTLIYKIDSSETGIIFEKYLSIIADFFLQSFGLISFLIAISILSWGISLIVNKTIQNLLGKIFYTVLYINLGCLFVYLTNNNSFWLIDNGNSGFLGEKSFYFLNKFYPILENQLSKAGIFLLACIFFILGSGINIKKILEKIFIRKNSQKTLVENNDVDFMHETKESSEIKQQSFSFKNLSESKTKEYRLPTINLLEKKQGVKASTSKNPSPEFIEKILLDFGIKGKINKVSNGPVVSLYEFEPAPGVKVS